MRSASSPRRPEVAIQQPCPAPTTPDPKPLRVRNGTGRPDQRNAPPRPPRTTYVSPTAGTSHPQTGSKRQSSRQRSTAYTPHPRQSPNIPLPCRNAATSSQTLQNSPTARAHSPPAGPDAPKRTALPSGALAVCADFRPLSTGRVPGQPGLARLPSPQRPQPRRRYAHRPLPHQ